MSKFPHKHVEIYRRQSGFDPSSSAWRVYIGDTCFAWSETAAQPIILKLKPVLDLGSHATRGGWDAWYFSEEEYNAIMGAANG